MKSNDINKEILSVVFVDDLAQIRKGVKHSIESAHFVEHGIVYEFSVDTFSNFREFQSYNHGKEPDVVLLDIVIENDMDAGLMLVGYSREKFPDSVIIMFSRMDEAETIARFLVLGADDFISKDTPISDLAKTVFHTYRIVSRRKDLKCNTEVHNGQKSWVAGDFHRSVAKRIPRIIHSAIRSVHLFGETGTGKEVISELFEASMDSEVPFIRINCGAIPVSIMESELFGHKKGAFTGAVSDKVGILEAANGGWVFLDEVALLPENIQMALLRSLENNELRRVGDFKHSIADFKIISASNEDLSELVKQGKFRKDLWQRLCDIVITIPPLRDRKEEIPEIAKAISSGLENGPYVISPTTMKVLCTYPWVNGNIRELRNCLRAMTETAIERVFVPANIPAYIFSYLKEDKLLTPVSGKESIAIEFDWDQISFSELEDQLFLKLLDMAFMKFSFGSIREVAKHIGMAKTTFSTKIKKMADDGKLSATLLSLLEKKQ